MNSAERYDLSLEVIVLLIYGTFMILFGALLVGILAGRLPFAPDSMYGLFPDLPESDFFSPLTD